MYLFCLLFFFITVRDIFGEDSRVVNNRNINTSPGPQNIAPQNTQKPEPSGSVDQPRRFISSILGGDVPYGARGHLLTPGARKAYPDTLPTLNKKLRDDTKSPVINHPVELVPVNKPINLTKTNCMNTKQPKSPSPNVPENAAAAVRCSVIQRTPSTSSHPGDADDEHSRGSSNKSPISMVVKRREPEQEQPINYHVPKREESREDERDRRREARRNAYVSNRPIFYRNVPRGMLGRLNGIMMAAAGHGRSSSNGGAQNNGGSSGGGSGSYSGSPNNSGSGGAVGGSGSGSGGMGGRDGRSNYGPNSPPTGSLPPFYESLKGGTGRFNANGAFVENNGNFGNGEGNQEITNVNGNFNGIQNGNFAGIALKDERDLDYEGGKVDPCISGNDLMPSNQYGYDMNEQMMVDIGVGVVDPLQFTATFTFSSPSNEHSLLDGLTDAVDLSQLLQRLPNDEQSSSGNEIDLASTPSITPDSVTITPGSEHQGIEPFPESLLLNRSAQFFQGSFEQQRAYFSPAGGKSYLDNSHPPPPPSYHQARDAAHAMLGNGQGSHHTHNSSSFEYFDSHSKFSLPSPGTANSLDENSPHGLNQLIAPSTTAIANTIQNVSSGLVVGAIRVKREAPLITESKIKVLQQRVSKKLV